MDLHLAGKWVLITGGSKGIGLATARIFAEEGARLVLVARHGEALEQARREIRTRYGAAVDVEPLDLAASGSAETLCAKYPDIEILVNNAGAIPGGSITVVDETTWRAAWDLKVFGFINLCRAYFARMRARKSGVIVNVIGLAGDRPSFDYVAGSAGNAALMALTRALGSHSVDDNVRVVAVNPTYTETERLVKSLGYQAQRKLGDTARWPELLKNAPFGRAARAEEIGNVVVFLASDRASYMSGTVVNVDGGVSHRGR